MGIEINVRNFRIFDSELMNDCYKDLFYPRSRQEESTERGPLRVILEDYLVVPAKGGSANKLKEWSDTTYFTHVLNSMVISGKLLDFKLTKQYSTNSGNVKELEKYIRLFFASVAMHDADKLFLEGIEGANNLAAVLEKNKQDIIKICSYYLASLGLPSEWWNDLSYLILRDENRSMDYANTIQTRLDRTQLATISQYVSLGDHVGGVKADNTASIFSKIKEQLLPYLKSLDEQINLIQFSDLPQILLMERLRTIFDQFLIDNNRHVLASFPDAIAYLGKPIDDFEYHKIYEKFSEEIGGTKDYIKSLLDNFAPSGNSIRLDFSKEIEVTPEVINTYIEKFKGRLLIWQGERWKASNPDFDAKAKVIGVPIKKGDKNGKPFFYIDLPEETAEEADKDIEKERLMGLIACAQRVLYACDDTIDLPKTREDELSHEFFGKEIFVNADILQRKTIDAISHAALFKEAPLDLAKKEYDRICNAISSVLLPRFERAKVIDYSEFFNRAIGNNFLIQDTPDKASMCVYCGIFAETPLKEENSFGIKATSGTGRKITVLKYDENKFNGKICKYCLRENTLRRSEIGKENEALCLHVHLGDYYVPVNLDNIINSLKDVSSKIGDIKIEYEEEGKTSRKAILRVGKRSKKDLGYHMIAFISKPGKRVEEFYRLYNLLDFMLKTGVKIRLTSLISSKRIFKPMFEWDNAPSWVKNLKMNEIRIDQLESVNRELKLMYDISRISGSKNALAWVIHDVNRGKRGIFQILWRSILSNSGDASLIRYPKVKEGVEWYMEKYEKEINKAGMEKVVDEACGVSTKGPTSNNDNTWIIREAMKVYLKYPKNSDKDLKEKIAGKIWDYANRQKYSGKETQMHCLGFSDAFVDLMRSEFKQRIPGNDYRKDLISQFALMYNIEKWKRIKNRKGESEVNE